MLNACDQSAIRQKYVLHYNAVNILYNFVYDLVSLDGVTRCISVYAIYELCDANNLIFGGRVSFANLYSKGRRVACGKPYGARSLLKLATSKSSEMYCLE